MNRLVNGLLLAVSLFAIYLAGVAIRRAVYSAQAVELGAPPPFTLESALNFRRIQQVWTDGRVPEVDPDIQYPQGIVVRRTDTVGAERIYCFLALFFPKTMNLAARVRWIEVLWFCLGIPLLGLWIGCLTRSVYGGAVAALFYAVSLASVIRSTGQEISHENMALPLLIGHLALDAYAARARALRGAALAAAGSAVLLALALVFWDLIQFYLLLWMIAFVARLFRANPLADDGTRPFLRWGLAMAALVLAGIGDSYLRAHGFLMSPVLLLAYGFGLGLLVRRALARRAVSLRPAAARMLTLAALLAPLLLAGVAGNIYTGSYGHFGELLWAKLRFLNHKPADPARLTFNQRIMWVPALHSANMELAVELFPGILVLTLLAFGVCFCFARNRSQVGLNQLLFFYAVSLITFWFFVRFQVFLVIFAAGLLGCLAAWSLEHGRLWRMLAALLLGAVAGAEAGHVLENPLRWGRPNTYYRELGELTQWLERNVAPSPVLANFGVSASILAYGGCPIVLHPKFESREIRTRVREYGEHLFKGTEVEFRDWAEQFDVGYYVYSLGEFSLKGEDRQMRYMVDALKPSTNSAAWIFEFDPSRATWFQPLWANAKYRVFKITTQADERLAAENAAEAEEALQRGDLAMAGARAATAFRLNPHCARAGEVLRHVGALRDGGFQSTTNEAP